MIKLIPGGLVIDAKIRLRVHEMFVAKVDIEAIMRYLRDAKQFQAQTYKLLREEGGLSYEEAKRTIHESETWADCREATEATHEAAYQAAIQSGFTEIEAPDTLERKRA